MHNPVGDIRQVDKLGRIVIAANIRRVLGIAAGDKLEVFADKDQGFIYLRKYEGKLDVK
jgi:transcriptional pleiotropic regulator of transition state genes